MQARSFKNKDYSNNWVQTAVSILGLVFVVLTSLGVITPEQSAQGLPIATSTVTAVGSIVGGIVMLIGIFFKPSV
jgi:uncharacterized membrane protein YphA (DoxX/SURF4 family)